MPIASGDVQYRFSTKSGSAGDTLSGNGAGALGKYASTTQLTSGGLHNLFDQISGAENTASDVEYRCIFVHNAHATASWLGVKVWVESQVAGGASIAIGIDPTAASDIDAAGAQAVDVTDENTAPAGVSFSTPTTKGTGLDLGDLGPDQVRAVWIRRTAANSAALANDGAQLKTSGDTV